MSAITRPTSINVLDDDVLLHIFAKNSNMFLYRHALHDTYVASQVCQRWRNLMLNTPSIWAKLIDVDYMSFVCDYDWWVELLKRSRTAPLWIRIDWVNKLRPSDPYHNVEPFLFAVLNDYWHQIQRLDACFQVGAAFHPTNWAIFCRPAPSLEIFDVSFERTEPAENHDNTPLTTLFSGTAPRLRTFGFPEYTIDSNVAWLCHLHFMRFDHTYTIRLALAVLSSTHQLQELILRYPTHETISAPFPIASLPHLKYLEYTGSLLEGSILLDHVKIPINCSLNISNSCEGIPVTATEEQSLSIFTTFVRYFHGYIKSHAPRLIELNYWRRFCITVTIVDKFPVDVSLIISIPLCKAEDSSIPLHTLSNIAFPELSCVIELKIPETVQLETSFGVFFCCFTSVTTICANSQTLEHLTALQYDMNTTSNPITLFPLLETINLHSRFDSNDTFEVDASTAMFIWMRLQDGYPITTLRLPDYCCAVAPDLQKVSKCEGLKVLYKFWIRGDWDGSGGRSTDLEYICGRIGRENSPETD